MCWCCASRPCSHGCLWMICARPASPSTLQSARMPDCSARLGHSAEYDSYGFGAQHPLRPDRLRTALDLIQRLGLGPRADQQLTAPAATPDELRLVHEPAYIDAVQRLDLFADDPLLSAEAT